MPLSTVTTGKLVEVTGAASLEELRQCLVSDGAVPDGQAPACGDVGP